MHATKECLKDILSGVASYLLISGSHLVYVHK